MDEIVKRAEDEIMSSLINGLYLNEILEWGSPMFFGQETARKIFSLVREISKKNLPCTSDIVAHELDKRGNAEAACYVRENKEQPFGPHGQNFKIVAEAHNKRLLGRMAQKMLKQGEDDADSFELLETMAEAQKWLKTSSRVEKSLQDVLNDVEDTVQKASMPDSPLGLITGIEKFDAVIGRIQTKRQIIIGARPGMGKTALGVAIGKGFIELNEDVFLDVYSLEISAKDWLLRYIGNSLQMTYNQLLSTNNKLDKEVLAKVNREKRRIETLLLMVHEYAPTIEELRARVRKLKLLYPGKHIVIMIDQIGKMSMSADQTAAITKFSIELEKLKNEEEITIIIMAQIRRVLEHPFRPKSDDLKHAGSLEEDADLVILLYRPEYYGLATLQIGQQKISSLGKIELIIAKNRQGQGDGQSIILDHELKFNRFPNQTDLFTPSL